MHSMKDRLASFCLSTLLPALNSRALAGVAQAALRELTSDWHVSGVVFRLGYGTASKCCITKLAQNKGQVHLVNAGSKPNPVRSSGVATDCITGLC